MVFVPKLALALLYDHLQHASTEGEGLVNLTTWSVAQLASLVLDQRRAQIFGNLHKKISCGPSTI